MYATLLPAVSTIVRVSPARTAPLKVTIADAGVDDLVFSITNLSSNIFKNAVLEISVPDTFIKFIKKYLENNSILPTSGALYLILSFISIVVLSNRSIVSL